MGCLFPEGNIGPEHNCRLNKDQIERVNFIGYQPVEEHELSSQLDTILARYKETLETGGETDGRNNI